MLLARLRRQINIELGTARSTLPDLNPFLIALSYNSLLDGLPDVGNLDQGC